LQTASLGKIPGQAGVGGVKKVADIISDSFIQSEWYSMLITVINSVLEKNLSPQPVVNFRSVFHRRRMRFAQVVAAALPNTTPEGIFPLTLPMFAEVAGLWPLGHPSREKEQMLEQPEFVHLKVDFRKEMTRFLHILFASASAKETLTTRCDVEVG